MYKNTIKNLNIDLLAKTIHSNVTNMNQDPRSEVNKLISNSINHIEHLDEIKIESTINLKKTDTKMGSDSTISGAPKQEVKRTRYKLLKLLGQEPQWIKSKKSVAEWKLRKDMIIGNKISIRGNINIERVLKLWTLSSQMRENKLVKCDSNGKRGVNKEGIEWLILINDWPMTDFVSQSINWNTNHREMRNESVSRSMTQNGIHNLKNTRNNRRDAAELILFRTINENYDAINDELRELKLMSLGFNLHFKWAHESVSRVDINNSISSFKLSYILLPQ